MATRLIACMAAAILCSAPLTASPAVSDAPAPPARVGATASDADLAEKLDRVVRSVDHGQFWGAVLVARDSSKGGKPVLARGYGSANDRGDPITAQTLLDIGSIAKQFTAAAILRLEMDGKLSIDDPVSKFFPGLPPKAGEVTLAHLIGHTSGMSDRGALQPLNFPDRDQAVQVAFESPFHAAPGEKFEYCNAGYVVLAAVIEKASGETFERYLRGMLFKPAGMASTGFLDGEGVDASKGAVRVVRGGRPGRGAADDGAERPLTILQDGWGWGFKGAGGVLTTLDDLLAWDRALRGTAILDKDAVAKLFRPGLGGYAMGWFVDPSDGGMRAHHSGSTRGFRAELSRGLDDDTIVAVITNERHDPVRLGEALGEALSGRAPLPPTKLRVDGYDLGEWKSGPISAGTEWRVQRAAEGVKMLLVDPKRERPVVESIISNAQAAALSQRLTSAIREGAAARTMPVAEGMEVVVTPRPYPPGADGAHDVPNDARWTAAPSYRSNRGDDPRPTLILLDAANGVWAVIAKMHPEVAEKLAADLAAPADAPAVRGAPAR